MHVKNAAMTPGQYLETILKQFIHEEVEQAIQVTVMYLKSLITHYTPAADREQAMVKMQNALLSIIKRESTSVDQKDAMAESLPGFIATPDQIEVAKIWLTKGYICDKETPDTAIYTPKNLGSFKKSILTVIYGFEHVPLAEKEALREEVLKGDTSDGAVTLREKLEARLPTAEAKEKAWNRIIKPEEGQSLAITNALMAGLYSWTQKELLQPYFAKFAENIETVYKNQSRRAFENYFAYLLPVYEPKEEFIVQLLELKANTPDTETNMNKELDSGIETLLRIRRIQAFAHKHQAKL